MKKLFVSMVLMSCFFLTKAQLIINELSQGPSGAKEYVEFLVYGSPTCDSSTVDLRGWVFDDNNGWHAAGSGTGIAAGHKRFSNAAQWASVRMGAIIVIYNETDRNALIPADDTNDANHDCVYILPSSSSLFDHNSTTPSASSFVPYAGSSYSSSGTWGPLGMSNSDDAFHSVSPTALNRPYHAIGWGNNIDSNTVYYAGSMSASVVNMKNLIDDNPFNSLNFSKDATSSPSAETPGVPNNLANLSWINLMKNSCLPFTSTSITLDTAICAGRSIFAGGAMRSVAGTYYDTILASVGCDTLKRTNLTIAPAATRTITASICSGSFYNFYGSPKTVAGTYLDTIAGSSTCDSVVTLVLSVLPSSAGVINQSICTGQSIVFNGVTRSTSGTYLDTLINAGGCDSVLTLNLTVNAYSSGSISVNICSGQTYLFNGINRTASGVYLDTLPISVGCDSILTLNLTVNPVSASSINQQICSGQSYLFNGVNRTTAGTYLDTLLNRTGCDSVITLNLSVLASSAHSISQTICAGDFVVFNGVNRTTAGTYLDTLVNSVGCDSLLTLNLSVNPVSTITQNINICAGDTFHVGTSNYSISGNYFDTLSNALLCDSIVHTVLSVKPTHFTQLVKICNGQSYFVGGASRTTAGVYTDSTISSFGCDSIMQTTLQINRTDSTISNVAVCLGDPFSGSYYLTDTIIRQTRTNAFGCDSVVIVNLTVNPLPLVSAGNDTTILNGESAYLSASGATNYSWNNGVFLAYNIVAPILTTTYYVTGTDLNLCHNTDTVTVFIKENIDTVLLAIPSAFTPNGDGINDIFKILASRNLSIDLFQVYNRWGSLIFESKDINVGWDGNFNGREQPIGSYVYYVQTHSLLDSRIKPYTGTVTLLR